MNRLNLATGFMTADNLVRETVTTGTKALDSLLGGGFEVGLIYLIYGDRSLHDDILRACVSIQRPKKDGGLNSHTIIIDSANMLKIDKLADYSLDYDLEPENVMDRIYISRAFNASQTYDLVMNHMDKFFDRVQARLLIVSGLPDLYISEGMTSDATQQLSHMATKLMTFTLNRNIITIVTAPSSMTKSDLPAGGRTLSSCAQVHIHVIERKSYFKYTLAKHPQYPVRSVSKTKVHDFGTTLPLSHFIDIEGME